MVDEPSPFSNGYWTLEVAALPYFVPLGSVRGESQDQLWRCPNGHPLRIKSRGQYVGDIGGTVRCGLCELDYMAPVTGR